MSTYIGTKPSASYWHYAQHRQTCFNDTRFEVRTAVLLKMHIFRFTSRVDGKYLLNLCRSTQHSNPIRLEALRLKVCVWSVRTRHEILSYFVVSFLQKGLRCPADCIVRSSDYHRVPKLFSY